jgi:hypothetical protein
MIKWEEREEEWREREGEREKKDRERDYEKWRDEMRNPNGDWVLREEGTCPSLE